MLDFDGVTKRFGPVTALDRCTFSARPGRARLRVGGDADVAAVLAAVLDRAGLVSFSYQPPTLSEPFRQAVAS